MNNCSPPPSRDATIAQLADRPLDVLVIGGGIVGAGVARDAAMRGLRIGLVEQSDFASGTSSRSSRLLHGGLRYLAQGRIGLVHQAGRERAILRRIAPHLCQPLRFIFPGYHDSAWPLWKLRIGVRAYDLICGAPRDEQAQSLDADQTLENTPIFRTKNLLGGVRYFENFTNDARLVIDTLRSAANRGAMVLNYAKFLNAERDGSRWKFQIEDPIGHQKIDGTAMCVVNAAGPWANRIKHSRVQLRCTKGVHLLVRRDRLPLTDAVVMPKDHRILFAIPCGENVILGTNDTDWPGDPGEVRSEPDDVRYILGVTNEIFDVGLNERDVVATWAGVRPLLADPRGGPSDISRGHVIKFSDDGWMDVAGGKLTTYRLMAEEAVNGIVKFLDRSVPSCQTANHPLPSDFSGVLSPGISQKSVEHFCKNEWSIHLHDIMRRRAGWQFSSRDSWPRVLDWMSAAYGWNAQQTARERENYLAASSIEY